MKKSTLLLLIALLGSSALVMSLLETSSRESEASGPAGENQELDPSVANDPISPARSEAVKSVVPTGKGYFAFPRGRRFEHDFESSFLTTMRLDSKTPASEFLVTLDGHLEMTVVTVSEEDWIARLDFSEVVLAGGPSLDEVQGEEETNELERGVSYVRLGPSGEIRGYRFSEEYNAKSRNMVRTLFSALHCVVPGTEDDSWSLEEADATGECLSNYAWVQKPASQTPGKLTKSRAPREVNEREPDTRGQGEATLPFGLRWPSRVHYEEQASVARPGTEFTAGQQAKLTFTLVDEGSVALGGLEQPELEGAWAPASGRDDSDPKEARPVQLRSRRNPDELNLAGLMSELQGLLAADKLTSPETYEVRNALVDLLRLNPDQFDVLQAQFEEGSLTGDAAMVALSAVGATQSEQAQLLFEKLLGDSDSQELLTHAIRSCTEISEPSEALLGAIRESFAADDNDETVRNSALLALGTLSSRTEDPSSIEFLMEQEATASTTQDRIVWLEALGNAGDPRIVEKLGEYVEHEDTQLRGSAVSALRSVTTPEADALLAQASTSGPAPIRARAIGILAARPGELSGAAVASALEASTASNIRREALRGLGRRAVLDDATRSMLEKVAAGDADEKLREMARSILER